MAGILTLMKPLKVLSISYKSRNIFGYAIWNAINDAEKRNKNYKLSKEFRYELGNIMLAISYRLDFLPFIKKGISEKTELLYDYVRHRDRKQDRYALNVPENITHNLLIYVDSFIFELRSCCELMEKLIKMISRRFKKFAKEEFTQELPIEDWLGAEWYKKLHKLRIDIFHHTAPYVDVDITHEPKYDLLFCKENIHDYNKSKNFTRLSEIFKIYDDFRRNILPLQGYIISKVNRLK